jgi:hypothetical protein
LDFSTLETLQKNHPAWRLLNADYAPLVAAFLHSVFIKNNVRGLPRAELVSRLEDTLFELRQNRGSETYPKEASYYLDVWAHEAQGWLRKYYPAGKDEPSYDLTPSAEKALHWLEGLTQRKFVGTESRLLTVFDLLKQLVYGSGLDPQARLADLERRRKELDAEIEEVRSGVAPIFDQTALRDRFQQIGSTARELLSDFREVEQNFRQLDRETREKIALWDGGKGELLSQIFGERDAIADSDQGRSFKAFWDFLMDPSRQEELNTLWEAAFSLAPIQELRPDARLKRIHFDWLEAGEHTQRTVALLSAQLRRFLDNQAWLESRRIMQILHGIEASALTVRDQGLKGPTMEIDALSPEIDLPFERPLYSPPLQANYRLSVERGNADSLSTEALFEQIFVDRAKLEAALSKTLAGRQQITLARLIEEFPLEHGLAELVVWLALASERKETIFDESTADLVLWTDPEGKRRQAEIPRIILTGASHGQ